MIRFGIIGCGMIANYHAQVISQAKELTLCAVYDISETTAQRFAQTYGCTAVDSLDALLEQVDAAAICLPSDLHYDAVMRCAKAGKHVICEKPIAARVGEAEEMIRCCHEHGVYLSVIFQHRFDPAVQAVRRAMANGDVGKVLWASTRSILYRDPSYFTNTPWHAKFGSGALLNQSIHYIDLLLYLLGDPVSVTGHCAARLHTQNETEDVGLAILNFPDGAPAVIEGTTTAYPGLYNELSIYGENGTFIIRNDALFSYKLKSGNKPEYDELLNPYAVYAAFRDATIDLSGHCRQYEDFAAAIRDNRPPAVSGEEGIRALRLIDAIYTSSKKQQTVAL